MGVEERIKMPEVGPDHEHTWTPIGRADPDGSQRYRCEHPGCGELRLLDPRDK